MPSSPGDPTASNDKPLSARLSDDLKGELHDLSAAAHRLGDELYDAGGQAIGYLEIAGLKYPVKHYRAPVDQRLHRGARLDEGDMEQLAAAGFRGIVNLCLENDDDAQPAARVGITALRIPVLDNGHPTLEQAQQFLDFVRGHSLSYVHCEQGKGRTGTMCAVYRMVELRWDCEEAIGEARRFGLGMPNQVEFLRAIPAAMAAGRIR